MEFRGVLLDFAGTLLVPVPRTEWVRRALGALGLTRAPAEIEALAADLERAGRSGGPEPRQIPVGLEADYARRDLSAERHRALYESLLAQVTGAGSALTRQLYDEGTVGAGWEPYPDTAPFLAELKRRRRKVAVVSNVGFDLEAVFAEHGLAEYVDAFVLSYRVGAMKPEPRMFTEACATLGVRTDEALMIGDSATADSGATAVGITTLLLPYTPAGAPHGLDAALGLVADRQLGGR